jgi:hypothetical protein
MAGRISKVKQADGRIVIHIIEGEGSCSEKDITFKCSEEPHSDLLDAFNALEDHVRKLLEWAADYAKGRVKITGATYSYNENTEVEGAVISGQVALLEADGPLVFNTPHLPFDQYSETGTAKLMPDEAIVALERLRDEARQFMGGKRRQGNFHDRLDGKTIAAEQGRP